MAGVIHVLYVDDEPDLLHLGKVFLEQSGEFAVKTTLNATKAIQLLEQKKFDAIISDYQMPDIDGIQFLVEVRSRFGQIPFILFTGKGREEVVIRAINNGADFYIQKGGDPEAQFAELAHKIKSATSRKKAEDSLRYSEERYQDLTEHSNEAIIVAQDGMLKLVNHRAVEFTGYTEKELLSMSFLEFIHPDDRALVGERYRKRVNGEESPSRYQFRMSPKNDGTRWVEVSVVAITWERRSATLNFLTDITERKLAEDALRESEERYRNVVEDQTEFICRFLPDGTHIFVNEAYCRYFGKSRSEIIGHRFRPKIPPEDQKLVTRFMCSLTPEHPVGSVDQRIIMPDGSLRWQRWSDRAIFHADGSLKEYQSVGRDITDRKQDEEALHEREEKYRTLTESSPDYIMRYDRQCRHTYINPAALRVSGLTEDKVIGKTHREIGFDEEQSRFWEEKITGVFETGTSFKTQFAWQSVEGCVVLDWMLTPEFSRDGTVRSVLGVSRDITQMKKVEEELSRKNEELQASCAQISATEEELRQQIEEISVTQDKLHASEERYRSLFEGVPIGLYRTNPSGQIIDINPALVRLLGYPDRDALLKVNVPDLYVNPGDRIRWQALTDRKEIMPDFEVRFRTYDGTIIWVRDTGIAVRDDRGQVIGYFGYIEDITERKNAEDALRKSEEQYRTLVESVNEAIILQDKTGEILTWNSAAEQIFGVAAYEVLGHATTSRKWETIREDGTVFPDSEHPSMHTLATGEACKSVVMGITSAKGTFSWVNINTSPLKREGDQKPYAVVISLLDITGRKQAEVALAESEKKYRTLFHNTSDEIYIHEMLSDGMPGQILEVNDTMCNRLGYTREELLMMTVRDIVSDAHSTRMMGIGQQLSKTGMYTFYGEHQRKDGSVIPEEINIHRVMFSGKNLVLASARDITERLHAEHALRESERKYRSLLENVPELILVHRNGIILYANPAAVMSLSYQPREVINRQVTDFIPEKFHERVAAAVRQRMSGNSVESYEIEVIARNGSLRTMVVNGSTIEFDDKPASLIILVDITDRKLAEEALRQKEMELHDILEGSPIPNFVIDCDHRVISWNKALEEATGYKAADMIGTTQHWQVFYDEKRPCLADLLVDRKTDVIQEWYSGKMNTVRLAGGAFEAIDFFPTLGTDGKWLRFSASVIRDFRGNVRGAVETLQDVTLQKRAEEEIRALQQFQQSIIDNANVWISVLDSTGTILVWNTTAEQISGYSSKEVIGKNTVWKQLYPDPAYQKLVKENITDIIKKNTYVENFETRIQTKDGDEKIIWWNSQPIRDTGGGPAQFIAIGRDYTEQKRSAESLRALRQFEESIIKNANIWISVLDGKGTVSVWNRAAEEISGYPADEVIGKNTVWSRMYPDKDYRRTVSTTIKETLCADTYLKNFETRIQTKNGEERTIWWNTCSLQDVPGIKETFITIGKDVTDQKRLSDAVQLANKKLNLLSGITRHDIKNQLMALLAYLELSGDELDPRSHPVEYINKAKKIAASIERQINLTKDYEDIGVKMPVWLNVNHLIQQSIKVLPLQRICVIADCPDIEVLADPLIDKVVYNLLDNAVRYGGEHMTEVRFSARESVSGLVIQCKDNGVGVREEDKSRLFNRGFGKNTGLGLFLSREILAITGITITENGTPEQGAQFEMTVPKGMYRFTGTAIH
jgi:PAS domain S-box-containing protein